MLLGILPTLANATNLRLRTTLGDIEIELLDNAAPVTAANFLNYVADGDYIDTFFHRSVAGFIIQGGGFTFTNGSISDIPTDPPIVNEFNVSNTRGTVAMAKLGSSPNSATSQWFINLADNSANLDAQNGGFTVFARVTGDGMAVADAIAALPTWNAGAPFDEIPLIDYQSGDIAAQNIVFISITPDSDDDGVYDDDDAFPADPSETTDTDGDGTGDQADADDDGDGLPDDIELAAGLDPLDASDADQDLDGDGFTNIEEYEDGTDLTDAASNKNVNIAILLILGGDSGVNGEQ